MSNEPGYSAFMQRISETTANLLLGHRILVVLVTLLLTGYLAYHAYNQELAPGFDKSIPLSHPYMETYTEYLPEFGGANMITIFVEDTSGDMFNANFFEVLDQITNEVLTMDGIDVRTVTSLFTPNVNYVAVSEVGFTGSRIVPADFVPTDERIEEVKENLFKSEEIGRTVARDLSGALVLAELVERDPITGQQVDYDAFAKKLETLRDRYESEEIRIGIIGFATFIGDMIEGARSVILFFAIALGITFFLLIFFAGSWKLATAAMVVALIAVIWQLGLVKVLGFGVDPLSILVPFLVLAIGVSHAVQMTNAWRIAVVDGEDSLSAARTSFNKLFIPGATALLSDAVGFAVIMLIDIDIIRELGITASIGVGVMLITNKFMLPVLLSYVRLSEKEQASAARALRGADHPLWRGLAQVATRRYSLVVIGCSAVIFGYGYLVGQNLIIGDSEDGAPEFWHDARYNEDIRRIVDKFTVGLDELVVLAEATKESACVDYPIMRTVDDFVWTMENIRGVRGVKSLSQVVRERNVGNYEANPKFLGLPRNEQMISANIYRVEFSQRLFNNDCSVMPVTIYTADHKAETLERIVDAVERYNANKDNDAVTFRLAMGNAGIMAATNEAVAEAELRMALILFAAVGTFCFLTFLSLRAALCIVVPLALVAFFGNAVMVWLNIGLKVSTLPVLALGVGVGVDYGIYLFARMQAHLSAGKKLVDAYYESLKEVGLAVIFTATTMSVGVATWWWSELKFQADMGILLAYMFFVNMVGAIVLMPALAVWLIGDRSVGRSSGLAH